MATRKQVVEQARTYLHTQFKHLGRRSGLLPGSGVDCVGLVLCIGEDLGLLDLNGKPFKRDDYVEYSTTPMHGHVLDECVHRLLQIPVRTMRAGDVVCINFDGETTHTAIITTMPDGNMGLIHAYNGGPRQVTEHILDIKWRRRIAAAFAIPGVTD